MKDFSRVESLAKGASTDGSRVSSRCRFPRERFYGLTSQLCALFCGRAAELQKMLTALC
jgi:hypothetical protein